MSKSLLPASDAFARRTGRTCLRPLVVLAAVAALAAGPSAAQSQPTCSIAGGLVVCSGGTTELCGPVGPYTFAWSNGDTARCITVGTGTYSLVVTSNGVPSTNPCTVDVVAAGDGIEVTKTAESEVDDGDRVHYVLRVRNESSTTAVDSVHVVDRLCDITRWLGVTSRAPWSQPANEELGGTVEWNVGALAAGETVEIRYEVRADLSGTACSADVLRQCENEVEVHARCGGTGPATSAGGDSVTTTVRCEGDGDGDQLGSCPRGPGFWKQQCAKKNGQAKGHGKFTEEQMDDILDRIDARFTAFDWSGDLEDFCRLLSPSKPKDARTRALRQVATFMANWAAGDLDLSTANGGSVRLDPEGSVDCEEFDADTIGELVDELDDVLAELADGDLDDTGVRERYESIAACLGAINERDDDCDDEEDEDEDDARLAASRLSAASPNPFAQQTGFRYEVVSEGGADVSIAIYDVAGRQVRTLVAERRGAGVHAVTWDGRNDAGIRSPRGIYFVRALIGGQRAPAQRLLFLRD
jgi:hypothetical protein